MSAERLSETVARPVRTASQMLAAGTITEFIDALIYDLDGRQYAATAAMLTLVIGVVTVWVENRTGKAVLRQVPPRNVPLTDAGLIDSRLVIMLALLAILVVVLVLGLLSFTVSVGR